MRLGFFIIILIEVLMDSKVIHEIVEKQKSFFNTGKTLDIRFRKESLRKLYKAILDNEDALRDALRKDLGKSSFESDMCEIRLTLSEISYQLKHIRSFARKRKVRTPLSNFASKSFVLPSPYGNTLIMSPWNYPVLLTLEPLCDSIAAGNTAIVKPSLYALATSNEIKRIISETFPEEYIAVIDGGREENQSLLKEKFDYIFFTGSVNVGKEVMRRASEYLTPVTLELGGKSPTIVLKDANIKLAAKRIVFGKYLNCGQTCVAPDYILVEKDVKEEFTSCVIEEIKRQFGEKPLENPDYGKIINLKHFERITALIDEGKTVYGGQCDIESLRIEPTVMDNVEITNSVMQEEIFGPIMPIISIDNVSEAISIVKSMPHPLAFYVFTSDSTMTNNLISTIGFGGGCINDVVVHLATSEMGFGGFGESGMGSYHGKDGFKAFSHYKSILDKKTWIDLPIRYQRYNDKKHKLLKLFLK